MKRRKPSRGSLITHALEGIKKESFDVIRKELRESISTSGIYALYKGKRLVRVGMSNTNIYHRLQSHSKSKKIDWDNASIFTVKKIKYLLDLETTVNRLAKPKYSFQKGRIRDEYYLRKILKQKVNEKQKILKKESKEREIEMQELRREIKKIKKVIQR